MATVKQVLDKYFFSFLDENGLNALREKMIETIIKAEYEIYDVTEKMIDTETHRLCTEVEHENSQLHERIDELKYELRQEKTKEEFFVPQTLEDEFKIQWIKDNWDKIPTI